MHDVGHVGSGMSRRRLPHGGWQKGQETAKKAASYSKNEIKY